MLKRDSVGFLDGSRKFSPCDAHRFSDILGI